MIFFRRRRSAEQVVHEQAPPGQAASSPVSVEVPRWATREYSEIGDVPPTLVRYLMSGDLPPSVAAHINADGWPRFSEMGPAVDEALNQNDTQQQEAKAELYALGAFSYMTSYVSTFEAGELGRADELLAGASGAGFPEDELIHLQRTRGFLEE